LQFNAAVADVTKKGQNTELNAFMQSAEDQTADQELLILCEYNDRTDRLLTSWLITENSPDQPVSAEYRMLLENMRLRKNSAAIGLPLYLDDHPLTRACLMSAFRWFHFNEGLCSEGTEVQSRAATAGRHANIHQAEYQAPRWRILTRGSGGQAEGYCMDRTIAILELSYLVESPIHCEQDLVSHRERLENRNLRKSWIGTKIPAARICEVKQELIDRLALWYCQSIFSTPVAFDWHRIWQDPIFKEERLPFSAWETLLHLPVKNEFAMPFFQAVQGQDGTFLLKYRLIPIPECKYDSQTPVTYPKVVSSDPVIRFMNSS